MDPNTPGERVQPLNALANRLRYHRYRLTHVGEHRGNLVDAQTATGVSS